MSALSSHAASVLGERWRKSQSAGTSLQQSPSAFTRSGALNSLEAGLLTWQIDAGRQPSHPVGTVAKSPELPAYSGGTVRDSHPLPFSLALYGEHLKPL